MRRLISLVCGFVAFLALVLIAEWVPDLLPRSPNLAYSSLPSMSSPFFPLVLALFSAAGLTASVLVWRRHRYALMAFTIFWMAWICGSAFFIYINQTHVSKKVTAFVLLIYMGIMFWLDLKRAR
jgi:hypothetical protein